MLVFEVTDQPQVGRAEGMTKPVKQMKAERRNG